MPKQATVSFKRDITYTEYEPGELVVSLGYDQNNPTSGPQLDNELVYRVKQFYKPTEEDPNAYVLLDGRRTKVKVESTLIIPVEAWLKQVDPNGKSEEYKWYKGQMDKLGGNPPATGGGKGKDNPGQGKK